MLGAITVSDQAHRQQQRDKEIVTPHSVCIALTATRMAGLMSIYVTVDVIPTEESVCERGRARARVCVRVRACLHRRALLAFYLGIASEQFTACQSFSGSDSRSERRREGWGRRRRKEPASRGEGEERD